MCSLSAAQFYRKEVQQTLGLCSSWISRMATLLAALVHHNHEAKEELMTTGHLLVLSLALVTHHRVHGFFQVVLKFGKEIIHWFGQFSFCHALSETEIREVISQGQQKNASTMPGWSCCNMQTCFRAIKMSSSNNLTDWSTECCNPNSSASSLRYIEAKFSKQNLKNSTELSKDKF